MAPRLLLNNSFKWLMVKKNVQNVRGVIWVLAFLWANLTGACVGSIIFQSDEYPFLELIGMVAGVAIQIFLKIPDAIATVSVVCFLLFYLIKAIITTAKQASDTTRVRD
jgi:uncharacterized membrane protein